MQLATRGKTGNGKVVEYREQDSGDEDQTKGALGAPLQSGDDRGEPPMKKLRSGPGTLPLTSPSSTSGALQGSDDDYETPHNKKRKPRKSFTSANKVKGRGRGKARLHALFDKLPTDVIYTSSASVWKEAREEVEPPIPDCPPDQSEPQWAYLLFSRDCSTCERTNIPYVDYYHRLRLCSKCDNPGVVLIVGSRAKKAFPDIPDVKILLDLLPHSNNGSSSTGKYYRVKGIEDIGAEWAAMRQRSEAEIQEFKNRKKRETEDIMTHGAFCETWDRDRTILYNKQLDAKREARQNEILSRLEELGHDPQDVRHLQVTNHSIFNTSAALTKKSWETIRPQLEAVIGYVKTQRLQRERDQIIVQRQALAKSVLKNYEIPTDVPRAFWKPLEEFVFWGPGFYSIIHQPNEVSVTASDFQPALDELPVLLANGARKIQADLLQRMIDGGATGIASSSPELNPDKISLATSIFWCRSNNRGLPVCGIESLASHRCRAPSTSSPKYSCLYYDHPASNLVAALLAVANLDPSTTAEQMDHLDLRFHCPSWANPSGPLAMNWRDVVRTYTLARWFSQVEASNQLRSGPWEVFSPEETAAIKEKEMANIADERFRFRCKTCADAGWIQRRELENHLQAW
ncbi:hypothetical protein FS837_008551 [Tulasnella sp. UAMH 9824]|nr:hypothetical protein FS837_008551 [Tulasnella sp. UAMH 9824]